MLRKFLGRLRRDKKGQGLVEYALIIGGVALIAAASISVFGHKTTDIISAVAAILPGAHSDDNNAIQSGHLIETGPSGTSGAIALDVPAILAGNGQRPPRAERSGSQPRVLRTASMVSSLSRSVTDRGRDLPQSGGYPLLMVLKDLTAPVPFDGTGGLIPFVTRGSSP